MQYEIFNINNKEDLNKYYPLLEEWWKGKGDKWNTIPPQYLSTTGFIIKDQREYICAAWLYRTDSKYGVINWVITNNHSKPRTKKRCLEFLLQKIQGYAEFINIDMLYLVMETKSLKKILGEQGFIMTSNNISEFFKKIK